MKIYGFFNSTKEFGDAPGYAISEDGRVLASHVSSCDSWSAIDLDNRHKHAIYDETFPEGWTFEFVRFADRDNHEGLQAALRALNTKDEPA